MHEGRIESRMRISRCEMNGSAQTTATSSPSPERVAVYLPHVLKERWACALPDDAFDACIAELVESVACLPFAHGFSVADPQLAITGLHAKHYWLLKRRLESLHAVELENIKPQDLFIHHGSFSHTRAFIFPSYADFAIHVKQEQYTNKKILQLRKRHAMLDAARLQLSAAKDFAARGSTMLALDIEAYEFNHSIITEIGFTTAEPWPRKDGGSFSVKLPKSSSSIRAMSNDAPTPFADYVTLSSTLVYKLTSHHILIAENLRCQNGVRVADNKFNFHGESITLPLQSALHLLGEFVAQAKVIVGHAIHADIQLLRLVGFRLPDELYILDTQTMWKSIRQNLDNVRLATVLEACKLTYFSLHNAGNDARFTMDAMIYLVMNGDHMSSS